MPINLTIEFDNQSENVPMGIYEHFILAELASLQEAERDRLVELMEQYLDLVESRRIRKSVNGRTGQTRFSLDTTSDHSMRQTG